jgi:RNA polymerase sigma factor (sigma-70 family)
LNRIATDPHWLRTLLLVGATDHRPDAELLDRFARYGEQAAFEAILRRHGPLVWGVCRRTLSNPADADDAFQATFLVLVQKAGRVEHGGQLGPWLYGVAVKVARRVRDKARHAPTCDPELAALLPDRDRPDPDADWLAHLDRELHALPAKFRDPMVLCELQGLSRTDAAERLRLREGTLSSRLARGRILLRQRLLKYGTLLPAGGLATLLGTAGPAPARLLGKTAESVAQVTAAGGILAGVVPASVARLTLEATGMGLFKLKIATAMAVTLTTLTLGLVAADGPTGKPDKPAAEGPKAVAVDAAKPAVIEGDLAAMQGVWNFELVVFGPDANKEKPITGRCVVTGDVMWMVSPNINIASRSTLRLKPNYDPKWLDFVPDGTTGFFGDGKLGAAAPAIYRVTAEGWEIALHLDQHQFRPAEFPAATQAAIGRFRMTRPKTPVAVVDAKTAEARREFVGHWTATRYAYPNLDFTAMIVQENMPAELTPEYLFVRSNLAVDDMQARWMAFEYALDPTKLPKWIDLRSSFDMGGKTVEVGGFGVYELAGDTLRISYRLSVPRVFRTLEFKAGLEERRQGVDGKSACALMELKRVKSP